MKNKIIPIIDKDVFLSSVDITSDCWVWNGVRNEKGYGQLSIGGDRYLAHRISFKLFNGELIEGLVIDHKCMNKACVKPEHIRQVTPAINATENSRSMGAINKARTHCTSGHELNDENVYLYKGHRECRLCKQRKSTERDYTEHNKFYKANMKSAGRSIEEMKELDPPTIECDIYDYIEVKGRISKKLFEKYVMPQLKEITALKAELKAEREAVMSLIEQRDSLNEKVDSLESQLEAANKIIEVLEKSNGFYAEVLNWFNLEVVEEFALIKNNDCDRDIPSRKIVGGKRARQALAEVEKIRSQS